ncbi:MAG TPA: response regulator [Alphaproteobacteria bacterium]|nr:response regulator [Alphaproteobacteria bacterium]
MLEKHNQEQAAPPIGSHLPAVNTPATDNLQARPDHPATVMVVEDEEGIREVVTILLDSLGYSVISATNGNEALEKFLSYTGTVDLLLTDLLMPGMNGSELATTLSKTDPELKVLYMSGYSSDNLPGDHSACFVQKPFTREALACKLREVLQGPPSRLSQ